MQPLKPRDIITWKGEICGLQYDVKAFYAWNIFAALLHGVNAILMLVFYYRDDERDQLYDLTTSYGSWQRINVNATDEDPIFEILTKTKTVWSGFSLNWTIFIFHLLSFVFQFAAIIPSYNYVQRIVDTGRHPLRFIEYSLSASLMLVCISLLTGIRDILILGAITVLCMSCQLLGLMGEYQMPGFERNVGHFVAWLTILASYAPIIIYYFVAVDMNDVSPPDFVNIIITVQALLFLSFGFVQLVQFYGQNWVIVGAIGRQAEISYVFLSIVAKTLLGWLIYVNLIMNADQIRETVTNSTAV